MFCANVQVIRSIGPNLGQNISKHVLIVFLLVHWVMRIFLKITSGKLSDNSPKHRLKLLHKSRKCHVNLSDLDIMSPPL